MIRSYKYRLYPTKGQEHSLNFLRRQACSLYNAALEERREAWKMCHKSIGLYDQTYQLKLIRSDDPTGIGLLNNNAAQRVLRRVDKTFKAFFRRVKAHQTGGYPRFKPWRRFRSLEFTFGNGVHLADARLEVQNVGPVKVRWDRPIPAEATIKAAVLTCAATDKWYACFQLELPDVVAPVHSGPAVGVDLGLTNLVALSTGECIKTPQYYRIAQKQFRRQQRHLARCTRGSHRRRSAVHQVAVTHAKIANQRRDFAHKLSTRLTQEFSTIAVEDLNVSGIAKSMFAKSVHDAGWSTLLSFLDYKASIAGSQVIAVDPSYTSQACSSCGCIVKKTLSVRVHSCPACGLVLDRDVNAAKNILHRALTPLGHSGQTPIQAVGP